jgi:hypothetical protein
VARPSNLRVIGPRRADAADADAGAAGNSESCPLNRLNGAA